MSYMIVIEVLLGLCVLAYLCWNLVGYVLHRFFPNIPYTYLGHREKELKKLKEVD